jgi:hypothetical protein
MASIVEKEARVAEERPVIAGVYYNRLRKGMLLQADPTIQFALGRHVGRVLYKDLEIKSPYNTYIHKGLPPGPIASPGAASLAAAAHPANVPYLYFVATRDGHHEFRMTLNEHVNAIRQVRGKAPPPKTKPLLLASAVTSKPSTKTATRKTPAKTASKVTAKPATRTAVKAAPKKSTKPTATTKKKRTTTPTKRPTTQTTSTTQ